MEDEKLLPKPLTDLPLPEKEIPAHLASQGDALQGYDKTNVFKSKFFLGFVALSVLIAFLIGGLMLGKNTTKQSPAPTILQTPTPTPDPTANWKSGIFNDLSFKYPSVYKGGYVCGDKSLFFIDTFDIPQNCPFGDDTPGFSLSIIKNKTLNQIKQDFLKDTNVTNKTTSDMTVDNHLGLLTKAIWPPGEDVVSHNDWTLYISNGNSLYAFRSFDLHIKPVDQKKYFDQIISTFKFTEPKISCRPRPSCLDTFPRCMMPITSDMCPPSITPTKSNSETSGVCAQDAKKCPDGSWVGRSGPNCEFKCPK